MLPAIGSAGQRVAAIAGRDPAKLAEFQRELAIPSSYLDLNNLLNDRSIDAVYIALPNAMHAEWTVRALEAGKKVLCEKPLALNAAEAERVIEAAGRGVLLENFSYQLPERRDRMRLSGYSARFSFPATEEHRPRFSRALGGGSFLDLGCYGIDFAHRWFERGLEVIDVRAAYRAEWGDAEESCTVRARCGETQIEIETSFSAPARQEFVLRYADGREERIIRKDQTLGLLQSFAAMGESAEQDLIRWRRNARVYEDVLARM